MGRFTKTFFILNVFVLISGCRPFSSSSRSTKKTDPNGETSKLQMTGMHVQSYGADGLAWELEAPYGEMYTKKNMMRVKNMHVTLYQEEKKSSNISALEGFMSTADGQSPTVGSHFGVRLEPGDMYVNKDVVVVSTDGTHLSTDWAFYHKKTDLITSTAPVKVVRNDSITNGVGLEASSDLVRVRIFNETLVIPDRSSEATQ